MEANQEIADRINNQLIETDFSTIDNKTLYIGKIIEKESNGIFPIDGLENIIMVDELLDIFNLK
jgi:hypothetical protein